MPSHNNNFINFIQLTFLFIQGYNAPDQRAKFNNLPVRMAFIFLRYSVYSSLNVKLLSKL